MKKRKTLPEDAKYIRVPTLGTLDANLRIKLKFDDVTKFWFFNEYIKAYLLEDPTLMPFIEKIKQSSMLARKFRLKKAQELRKKEQDIINRFGLNQDDIEDIFDMIEREEDL
ncbi:MAG: hypothetical protein GOVbin630_2 [Prokaryotic dsDNA virus sp.]|nr:MAG: hypothetical protein GOVbin630_2 [Prokaryotic dsDNA virus sp.]|tara:strand:+ start:683 stop:1018 length:336 start_codon:yes stop_codon:yes gene_type:complete